MQKPVVNTAFYLSMVSALAVAVSAVAGLWIPATYARETPSWATQGVGQDAVNLFVAVPLLLVSVVLARRGKRLFLFLAEGILLYFIYSYILYGFSVHFNGLFLVYCAALGFSTYALAFWILGIAPQEAGKWFDARRPTIFPGLFLLALALLFYFLWLSEDIPAVFRGKAPDSLPQTGLFTNPVHVLDLSLVLPAMVTASLGLLRRKPFGYWFFPVMGCFSAVMGLAIIGMMIALHSRGLSGSLGGAGVMGAVVAGNLAALAYFLRSLKKG